MNVLFHGWEYPPNGAGVGMYMHYMARALNKAGHHVVVVTGRAPGRPEQETAEEGLVYRAYDRAEVGAAKNRGRVLALAREHRIDWIEGADHLGECAGLLREKNRPPVVIKVHSSNALRVLRDSQVLYPWQRWTIALACLRSRRTIADERATLRHADILLAPSERVLEELRKQEGRTVSKVRVVPNPVEIPDGWQNREAGVPTILLVGRIDVGKGIQYLPRLLEHVARKQPEVVLEIAGGDTYARGLGSMQKWLERLLGENARRIRFLGRLNPGQLDEAYRRAWVVVVPSRWDNFPTAVLEAMARAKPIVASPHGGMCEMLGRTESVIADPATPEFAEAVWSFLDREPLRRSAGQSGRRKAQEAYAPGVVAAQYVDAVTSFL